MCLIGIAHRISDRYPLVIAANRDEDYQRATHDAHPWDGAEEVIGGKDALYGGSWLAIRRGGRFSAVTNLRGAERKKKSRGFLVRDFVTGDMPVDDYAKTIAHEADDYAGFHLLAGHAGADLMYIAPDLQMPLAAGVHAFSNAPRDEHWPKVDFAVDAVTRALEIENAETLIDDLMRFLCSIRGSGSPESEVFIRGDRYGTRSSTVIVATQTEILFAEQSYSSGGVAYGERRLFCLVR
jgi:uncharacterized protein with NRDE domain